MLRSDLCDCSDAYITVKGRITVESALANNGTNKKLTSENNSPFRSCIPKIKNTFNENGEDFDIVMPMCSLLEYSHSYSMTSRNLLDYYKNELN